MIDHHVPSTTADDDRTRADRPARRLASRTLRALGYTLAFVGLPLGVGAAGVAEVMARLHSKPEPHPLELAPPPHHADKPTVAVLLSHVWTEATDFLGPYEVFAASDAFNVYAVAPERALTSLNGAVDVMPHYSIEEFEARGMQPDVVVVPYVAEIHGEANRPLLAYIEAQAERGATILSICAGAEVAAASGVFEGRRATTIWSSVNALEKAYPGTEWVRGMRYVDDGNVVSSAGVTSGIDASLYLLKRMQGEAVAERVAAELNYPHTRFMNDPVQPTSHTMLDLAPMALHAAYGWDRPVLGVALQPGVTEFELASIADTYTPAVATVATIADERGPITTAHGLRVVPRYTPDSAPRLDRLMIPGTDPAATELASWARQQGLPVQAPHADLADAGAHYAFDAITLDLARSENVAVAEATATSIEYPIDHLRLEGSPRAGGLMVRPLLLGLLGASLAFALDKGITARRAGRPSRAAPPRPARASLG